MGNKRLAGKIGTQETGNNKMVSAGPGKKDAGEMAGIGRRMGSAGSEMARIGRGRRMGSAGGNAGKSGGKQDAVAVELRNLQREVAELKQQRERDNVVEVADATAHAPQQPMLALMAPPTPQPQPMMALMAPPPDTN